ncbi:hypothetical protein BCF11_2499 [Collimonas sp. PA-H2]|jgi:hypothetical protein|uniref:hypothetical protein n=1 Tax=Collimonas sp. PA-H2 TaxID=1881062 RepID=UPI000BF84F0B|nr:hypothetical protein [Collimonas sp. PA-H2]PFH10090.1 hypothetical protein BCF11_2499 [Collimonas sp. PA-H2]
MGTSSTSLFADDVASDVRDEFTELLARGVSAADATQSLMESWSAAIKDVDDGPTFWLALAATQWKFGCLGQEVQTRAVDVIDSGRDLNKWNGASAIRRGAVLSALKDKLLSPLPPLRRPRRRKIVAVPSIKVPSPDGRGLATAFEITPSSALTTPQMQVMVELVVGQSRGGGGVFVADCEFDKVTLDWLDAETLQISYPRSVATSSKSASYFYYGRVVQIKYISTPD